MTTFLVVMSILIVLLIISLFGFGYYAFTKILKEFLDINTTLAACNKSIMDGYTDVKNQIGEFIKAMEAHSDASFNRYKDIVKEFNNISSTLKAPIDKINDVHNRVKTLNSVVPDKAYLDTLRDSAVKAILDKLYESPDKVYFTALGEQIVKEVVNSIAQSQSKPQPISGPEDAAPVKPKKQASKTKKTEIKN